MTTAPSRVMGGLRARSSGQAWEDALDATHAVYERMKIACITKLPVPTAPAPRKFIAPGYQGPPLRVLSARQGYDFCGYLLADCGAREFAGRIVAMEAKSTAEGVRKLRIDDSGVRPHQLTALAGVAWSGGIAAIVWKSGESRTVFCGQAIIRACNKLNRGVKVELPIEDGIAFQRVFCRETGQPAENWIDHAIADAYSMRLSGLSADGRALTPEAVLSECQAVFRTVSTVGVSLMHTGASSRHRDAICARAAFVVIARDVLKMSFPEICECCGMKSTASPQEAYRKWRAASGTNHERIHAGILDVLSTLKAKGYRVGSAPEPTDTNTTDPSTSDEGGQS